jgi:hypothetical protein
MRGTQEVAGLTLLRKLPTLGLTKTLLNPTIAQGNTMSITVKKVIGMLYSMGLDPFTLETGTVATGTVGKPGTTPCY